MDRKKIADKIAKDVVGADGKYDADIKKIAKMTASNDHIGALIHLYDKILNDKRGVKALEGAEAILSHLGHSPSELSKLVYEYYYKDGLDKAKKRLDEKDYNRLHGAF